MHVNLEKFPTSPSAKRMLDTVTKGWYDKSYVGKWIFQVMGSEIDDVQSIAEGLKNQIFAETATWGIIYHEMKYGIPFDQTKDLDDRRRAVINKRDHANRMPFTPYFVENLVKTTFMKDSKLVENKTPFTFTLEILLKATDAADSPDKIEDYINRIKPSHLTMNILCSVEAADLYENEKMLLRQIETGLSIREKMSSETPVMDVKIDIHSNSREYFAGNVMMHHGLNQWNGLQKFNGTIKFNTEIKQEAL